MGATKRNRREDWLIITKYTLLFAVLAVFFATPYLLHGKSLVNSGDGFKQHIKALDYYGRWLRAVLTRFRQGDFSLPAYSFAFGYGGDVATTLHYYVIGDPLALFSVFFDTEHIVYLYNALILIRLYLSGITFLCFVRFIFADTDCTRVKYPADGFLAGSLMYVFCGYAVFTATRHPFFLNPVVLFPLVLLGIEKAVSGKSYRFLAVSVAVSAVCNFYFFYMIVLASVIYVIWRLCCIYGLRRLREALPAFLRIVWGSVLGVMLSAFLFLPVVIAFLNTPRMDTDIQIPLLYDAKYYLKFFLSSMTPYTNGSWTHLGLTWAGVSVFILLFVPRRKKRIPAEETLTASVSSEAGSGYETGLRILSVFLLVCMCIPFAGYVFSGFSYASNRWTWAVSLLAGALVILKWEELQHPDRRQMTVLWIAALLYIACAVFLHGKIDGNIWKCLMVQAGLFPAALIFISFSGKVFPAEGLLLLVCLALSGNIWFMDHTEGKDNVSGTIKMDKLTDKLTVSGIEEVLAACPDNIQEAAAVLKEKASESEWNSSGLAVSFLSREDPEEFIPRYSGKNLDKNESVIEGLPSIHYYWSISNGYIARYLDEIANNTFRNYDLRGLDDRAMTMALTGTRYYTSKSKYYVPFGFERLNEEINPLDSAYHTYKNKYTLPFGYTYSKVITKEQYDSLDAAARQEAMLQGIVLTEEGIEDLNELGFDMNEVQTGLSDLSFTSQPLTWEAVDAEKLEIDGNSIKVKKKGASVKLVFSGIKNAETCLYVKNLQFTGRSQIAEIRVKGVSGDKTVTGKTLTFLTPENSWYAGRHDFIVNTGYSKSERDSIILTFAEKGTYTFDSIQVIAQPMDGYPGYIESLSEFSLKDLDFHEDKDTFTTNCIEGTITLEEDRILCLAMPFDKGWTAWVDGEKTPVLQGNTMYAAVGLKAGDHHIVLKYRTPGASYGLLVSICALILLAAGVILEKRNRSIFGN